jgi:hypothetical protein
VSRWQAEPVVVGIGATSLAWLARDAHGQAQLRTYAHSGVPSGSTLREALLAGEPPAPARRMNLVFGGSLAVHWVQQPVSGVSSLQELRTIALGRCIQLFGGAAADWLVAGDWRVRSPFLCAAVPARWSEAATQACPAATVTLNTTFALALARCARHLPADAWTVVGAGPQALLLRSDRTGLQGVRTLQFDASAGPAEASRAAATELRRWALREGWSAPGTAHWISLKDDSTYLAGTAPHLRPYWTSQEFDLAAPRVEMNGIQEPSAADDASWALRWARAKERPATP